MTDSREPLPSESPPAADLTDPASRLKLDRNDTGNAKRLVGVLRGQAVYVVGRGWGVWDSKIYNFEGGTARMLSLAGAHLQRLLEEEAAAVKSAPVPEQAIRDRMAEKGEEKGEAEKRIKAERSAGRAAFAKTCGNISRIRNAIELAASDFMVSGELLDADRTVMQMPNGTLDLAAIADVPEHEEAEERAERWRAALRPHDREVLATRLAGAPFDPDATAPEFERFCALVQPNEADRAYMQRCAGMVLGGRQGEVLLMLLGKGGNGKSTLVKGISAVMGDYVQPCRIDMFLEHRNTGGTGPTPEEAVLPGARAFLASEPRPGSTLDAGKVKGLTGGDRRQANPKNKDVFNYTPVGVPVIQANRMPTVNDPSEGFWRRVFVVLFGVPLHELPEAERRSEAEMSAMIEREKSGILNWMLEGYAAFRAQGLDPPERVMALKTSLRALADPVGQFLAEHTVEGSGLKVKTAELHKAFTNWIEKQGDKAMSAKAFTATMLALDYARKKTGGDWYWQGIDLADRDLLHEQGGA